MRQILLPLAFSVAFGINLLAVPAAPFLITFAQPDGSTFKAHLRGDEYFSWIESKNKMIIVKNKTNGYFEFALLKLDINSNFELAPSGIPVIKIGESNIRSPGNIPKISRVDLVKIRQRKIALKKGIKIVPTK
tara:strand:+ start:540 stop:938 length:399 start_codon:yes stop_codon:yes gene_type:complete